MDATTYALRHTGWANQQVFRAVAGLPDEALSSYIENAEWTAGRILMHITRSSARYRSFLLPDQPAAEYAVPTTMAEVLTLADELRVIDADLASAASLEDALVERRLIDGTVRMVQRVTIVAQVVHHATEHRAQLVDALNARGYFPLSLDDVTPWHFEGIDSAGGR